jgi:iron(III) transport system substrate-binding protein
MRSPFARARALALVVPLFAASNASAADPGEVNIYSYRQPYLIDLLLNEFTEETGIKINVIFAEKGLIERIQAEGRNSPADVLLTVDVGNLTQATDAGIAQPIQSAALEAAIPPAYRATDGEWVGLTRRARVVYASKERVKQDKISYEELADPKWRGKICIRSGQHVYNVALIASMIAHHGEEWTEAWLRGVKANLARKPADDDRLQVKGVYAGECDLAVGNTYYMGRDADKDSEQKEWANSARFPDSDDRGTHVNISGAVVAKYARHKDNAIKLPEFLSSDKGQEMYADVNNEYPVKEGIPWSKLVQS